MMNISSREKRFVLGAGVALIASLAINYLVVPAISSQFRVRKEYEEKRQALLNVICRKP